MSEVLERRYRRLMQVSCPAEFRDRHGEEMVDMVLAGARPGRQWPAAHEVTGLLRAGLGAWLRTNRVRPVGRTWVEGLRLAVLVLLASACVDPAVDAVSRGWIARPSIAALWLAMLAVAALVAGRLLPALVLVAVWEVVQARWAPLSWELVVAAVLLVLLIGPLRGRPARLSPAWLLVVPLVLAIDLAPFGLSPYHLGWIDWMNGFWLAGVRNSALLLLALAALAALLDARIVIAAGILAASLAVGGLISVPLHSPGGPGLNLDWSWGPAALLAVAMTAIAAVAARRRARV